MDQNSMYKKNILRNSKKIPREGKWVTKQIVINTILILYTLFAVIPILWLLLKSFSKEEKFLEDNFIFPRGLKLNFDNYIESWLEFNIGTFMLNSIIVAFFVVLITVTSSLMVAFALNIMKWKYGKYIKNYFLVGLTIPAQAIIIPLYINYKRWNVLDTRIGIILPIAAFALPYSIYILTEAHKSFSKDIMEASLIDGCSIYKFFLSILIPIIKPFILVTSIFVFISAWNELLIPMVLTRDVSFMTLPVGILNLKDAAGGSGLNLLPALVLSVLPSATIFIITQNRISKNEFIKLKRF